MCGILGCLLNRPLRPDEVTRLHQATAALAHRGPDGRGEYVREAEGLYLGHRRLSIIDLSDANAQPMKRGDGVLTYNGEIYNFQELARELADIGEQPATSGDTEILLMSWLRWGPRALQRFDGMFAFALFDGKELHLATDPFGEKPLYLLETKDGIYFASEPEALRRVAEFPFEPDAEDVAAFLCLGFVPAPRTGYRGLKRLLPGTHMRVRAGRIVSEQRYWMPPPPIVGRGSVPPIAEETVSAVEDALTRSLKRRLVSDVPLGLFLSSGADSGLVAALLARRLNRGVTAVTVAFPDGANEAQEARATARHFGLDHIVIDSRDDRSLENTPHELVRLYGEPNDNTTAIAVRQMCRVARATMIVALSGSGGDELFFGYQKYAFMWDKRRLYRWLAPLVDVLRPIVGENFKSISRWQQARNFLFRDPVWQFLAVKNGGAVNWLRQLPAAQHWAAHLFPPSAAPSVVRSRMFDIEQTLPSSYIAAIERGSMRAGMEVRSPFLSRDVYDVVARIDQRSLIAYGRKSLAFRILSRHLPEELINRRKQGFVAPRSRYLATTNSLVPSLPHLGAADPAVIWKNRHDADTHGVAIRLKILEEALRPSRVA